MQKGWLLFFKSVTVLAETPAELAMLRTLPRATYANSTPSPLKPAELQVLRAQYEKEGEHVGVQTKFNFAWVSERARPRVPTSTDLLPGFDQIQRPPRTTRRRSSPL